MFSVLEKSQFLQVQRKSSQEPEGHIELGPAMGYLM